MQISLSDTQPIPIPARLHSEYDALSSEFFEIRVAEMSGFDYIFLPMAFCDQIIDFVMLQELMISVQDVLGSELDRMILVGVEEAANGDLILDRYNIDWSESMIVDCCRSALNETPQYDFVRMLQEHSSPLLQG